MRIKLKAFAFTFCCCVIQKNLCFCSLLNGNAAVVVWRWWLLLCSLFSRVDSVSWVWVSPRPPAARGRVGIDSAEHLIKSPSTSRFRFDSGDTVPAGFTIATDLLRSPTTRTMRSSSVMLLLVEKDFFIQRKIFVGGFLSSLKKISNFLEQGKVNRKNTCNKIQI